MIAEEALVEGNGLLLASVVIPTRARADTLIACLRSVVAQTEPDLEIIVSNNGGDPATRDVVADLGDSRVRCVEPPRTLSMSHNFEFGLSCARGRWLIVVGDDDGILPGGIRRGLEMLVQSGAEALASPTCAYQWPTPGVARSGTFLTVPMGRGWSWRDSGRSIARILSRDIGFNAAPVTYTGGIISADLFQRIKAVRGSFFQSQIPDCYSAFAISSSIERFIRSDEPLMVAGISRHSHGKVSLTAEPNAFNAYENIPFHPAFPVPDEGALTSSFQALLYESYLQSAYLRTETPITTMHEQIIAVLAYARWFRDGEPGTEKAARVAEAWARKAATQYGFDFPRIDRAAARLPVRAQISQHRQRLASFVTSYAIDGSFADPVDDVFAACTLAARIRDARPSRLANYGHRVARVLKRRYL